MPQVLVPLASGFEEIEAITIIDILRRADVEVTTACLDRRRVIGAHGIKVLADTHIDECDYTRFDMIVLPGGLPGATNLRDNETIGELLCKFDQDNKFIGAICAAPIALAKAGVIKSAYTCYPSFEKEAGEDKYVGEASVISDQNIITSKGPAFAIEFSLELIEKLCSAKLSQNIKKQLLLD